jgi:hypothetical protein
VETLSLLLQRLEIATPSKPSESVLDMVCGLRVDLTELVFWPKVETQRGRDSGRCHPQLGLVLRPKVDRLLEPVFDLWLPVMVTALRLWVHQPDPV